MSSFYLTTAIPYINAKPHLGHVLEWFQADATARFQRLRGHDVAFASGADENSLKNVQAAEKAGIDPQAWLDDYAAVFQAAYEEFGISLTSFRRSSDQKLHWPGVQKLWQLCDQSGDIYQKTYEGLYCTGCEAYYTPDELVNGNCPEHLVPPEKVKEENYFFRLSKYQDQIKNLIESGKLNIVSEQFRNEMLGFINQGLEDFSISRSTQRARGVGVPVPGDSSQTMYVWFDALTVYMTAIGWGFDEAQWQRYWPANVHMIGKGINRFHSVYWIGMLLSAGLPTPQTISVHGYITANGQKMSKSLGNVVDPFALIKQYGLDPLRYYLLKEIPSHSDGDFSDERFRELYTADLANGLGNLCSRVAKLCEKTGVSAASGATEPAWDNAIVAHLEAYELDLALKLLQARVATLDGYLSLHKPWQQTGDEQRATLEHAVAEIRAIAWHLQPFMPTTASTIYQHFSRETITAMAPLFPRLPV